MDLGLTNKVVLISGGAQGIGEGIVRGVAAEGGIPVIVDRKRETAERLVDDLANQDRPALFVLTELSDPAQCQQAVEESLSHFGRLDALVNNAGTNDGVGLASGSPEAFVASFHKNLHHYYYLAHFALDALMQSRGAVVNISSKTAVTGQGNTSAYAAAKGAQLALTREWAVELLPFGIRVNAIVPAEVMTPMYADWLQSFPDPEAKRRAIVQNIPLGQRMTTKEEIAAMVLFLISSHAAHITGQCIHVDGGYVHLDRALVWDEERGVGEEGDRRDSHADT